MACCFSPLINGQDIRGGNLMQEAFLTFPFDPCDIAQGTRARNTC